jgi:hypothetical protein
MASIEAIKAARKEVVLNDYKSAVAKNKLLYLEGDNTATSEYIFQNQIEDAANIVDKFYKSDIRVISVQKLTKVGADGTIIEIAKGLTTHIDDNFAVNPAHVRIITGMSNAGWEKDMKDKVPICFKNKIFHHGKLSKSDLSNLKDGLVIIDEIDTGNGEGQVLHRILKDAGLLDIEHMKNNNNRFVFISATMIKELYDLYGWGTLHESYNMTIPQSYIGHKEFLELGIIKEFYPLDTNKNVEKWIQEDILDNYGNDYRVHIVRVNSKTKNIDIVQNGCIRKGVSFKNNTSENPLTKEEISELFIEPLTKHIVMCIKGFFRRANLIPNSWKVHIGATHELYTKDVNCNVQIQGLPGRMTGYWKDVIVEKGHKTGPYRTSIRSVQQYLNIYNDPFGNNSYQCMGFNKKNGKVTAKSTMLSSKNIDNLEAIKLPELKNDAFERGFKIFNTQKENENYAKQFGAKRESVYTITDDGFKICTTTSHPRIHSLEEIIKIANSPNVGSNMDKKISDLKIGDFAYRKYVCYELINDKTTERYVTIWIKRLKFNE